MAYISDLKCGMAWSRDAIKCYSQGPWPLQLLILTFLQVCTHGLEVHGGGSASAITKDAPWPALRKGTFLSTLSGTPSILPHSGPGGWDHAAQDGWKLICKRGLPSGSLETWVMIFLPGFPTELRTPTHSLTMQAFPGAHCAPQSHYRGKLAT